MKDLGLGLGFRHLRAFLRVGKHGQGHVKERAHGMMTAAAAGGVGGS